MKANTVTGSKRANAKKTPNKQLKGNKSRQRWELILKVATELFTERGFHASSMRELGERAGIRKESLYYYVKSKQQLLFEILHDLHRGGEALVDNVNFDSPDPIGELRSLLVQMAIYAGKHADRLEIFANDFDYLSSEQQTHIISERHLYGDAIVKLITLAVEAGQISKSLDIRSAAQVTIRAVSSISQWYTSNGPLQIEQIAVQTAAILVGGLVSYDSRQLLQPGNTEI